MSQTKYCPRHPNTETALACGKCGEPVCPRCMVHTPVGVRCRDCAQVTRLPTFDITGAYLVRAIVAGVLLAAAGGTAYVFLAPYLFGLPYVPLIALVGMGFLIGEGISVSVNRKRGRTLKYVAAGAMLVSYSIISVFTLALLSLFGLLAMGIALYVAVSRF